MSKSQPSAEKKTERIDAFVTVSATGHACCPRMAWESPWVEFDLFGRKVRWHSDGVTEQLTKFGFKSLEEMRGKDFGVSLLVRGDKVWRVNRLYAV